MSPYRKQEFILLIGIFTVLIIPLWVFGLKSQGMETCVLSISSSQPPSCRSFSPHSQLNMREKLLSG
jgi:hypothetical protein